MPLSTRFQFVAVSFISSSKERGVPEGNHRPVVSSNPAHCEVYSMEDYVIKLVSDMRGVIDFLRVLWFPSPIKRYN